MIISLPKCACDDEQTDSLFNHPAAAVFYVVNVCAAASVEKLARTAGTDVLFSACVSDLDT